MANLGNRMVRAAKLDADLYEEVEADKRAMGQAMAAAIWMLVAMVIAVRQALDYQSTFRTVAVCLIGWVIQAVLMVLVFSVFGGFEKAVR